METVGIGSGVVFSSVFCSKIFPMVCMSRRPMQAVGIASRSPFGLPFAAKVFSVKLSPLENQRQGHVTLSFICASIPAPTQALNFYYFDS
jgi:hypothetical protein